MSGGQNQSGEGLDQELKLLAGDVRINPVAECFLRLIEPGLKAFPVHVAGDGPVVKTEKAPGMRWWTSKRQPAIRLPSAPPRYATEV
jgi:hypothetical protein